MQLGHFKIMLIVALFGMTWSCADGGASEEATFDPETAIAHAVASTLTAEEIDQSAEATLTRIDRTPSQIENILPTPSDAGRVFGSYYQNRVPEYSGYEYFENWEYIPFNTDEVTSEHGVAISLKPIYFDGYAFYKGERDPIADLIFGNVPGSV